MDKNEQIQARLQAHLRELTATIQYTAQGCTLTIDDGKAPHLVHRYIKMPVDDTRLDDDAYIDKLIDDMIVSYARGRFLGKYAPVIAANPHS